MFKSFTLAACAAVTLAGCVVATPIIAPNGQQGFTIDCSATNDVGHCYKKAGELCGNNGYEIFDKNDKQATFWSGSSKTMVVRCKLPNESNG